MILVRASNHSLSVAYAQCHNKITNIASNKNCVPLIVNHSCHVLLEIMPFDLAKAYHNNVSRIHSIPNRTHHNTITEKP
jgi:hypothetical protein